MSKPYGPPAGRLVADGAAATEECSRLSTPAVANGSVPLRSALGQRSAVHSGRHPGCLFGLTCSSS